MSYQMKPHEREYTADILEFGLQFGFKTTCLRAFLGTNDKGKKVPKFKCILHSFKGGKIVAKEFEEESVEELRYAMGNFMHSCWDKEEEKYAISESEEMLEVDDDDFL